MRLPVRIPNLANTLSLLLVTFLVLFPKGGIKLGGAPLTWGYALLGLSFLPLAMVRLLCFPLRASATTFVAFASILPFQIVLIYSLLINGSANTNYAVAMVTILLFLPMVFLGIFPGFLRYIDYERFCRQFCFCILAAALWGIFLFFYHPLKGHYIEIPYLTVNAGDYGQLENTKNISRGAYLKLISTYNNGNLYGVATLILLPLYIRLEPKAWKRHVVRVALVLTLSRTVWLGLVVEQALSLLARFPHVIAQFPRIRLASVRTPLLAIGATVLLTFSGLLFNGNGFAFLFNSGLGGRESELSGFLDPSVLPNVPVRSFDELVYASALNLFGISGFIAFMLIFLSPILIALWKPYLVQSVTRRAALKGLILYAAVASLDGAIILIPVMAFYWFAYMTLLHGLPGEAGLAQPAEVPLPELQTA